MSRYRYCQRVVCLSSVCCLSFTIVNWGQTVRYRHTVTMKLQSMQNQLARTVLWRSVDQSSTQLLKQLHWLPVICRMKYKIGLITHNVLNTGQPAYLRSLLTHYQPTRTLRSADQHLLTVPNLKTEFARRAFSFVSPTTWNDIPLEIRQLSSVNTFKSQLKTHYFSLI